VWPIDAILKQVTQCASEDFLAMLEWIDI